MLPQNLWILLAMMALIAVACVRRIPEGQVHSMRRLGGQVRFLGAGMHFVMPLIERVSHRMSLSGSQLEIDAKLNCGGDCHACVYYQVLDPERADTVIESVDSLLRERAVALLGHGGVPGEPNDRRAWLKQSLNSDFRERGLLVTRIDLRSAA